MAGAIEGIEVTDLQAQARSLGMAVAGTNSLSSPIQLGKKTTERTELV